MRQFLLAVPALFFSTPGAASAAGAAPLTGPGYLLLAFLFGMVAGALALHWLRLPPSAERPEERNGNPSAEAAPSPEPTPPPVAQPERRAAPRTELSEQLVVPATPVSPRSRVAGMEVIEHHQLSDQGSSDLYQTVAGVLLRSLDANPTRNDLRYKLLEVLFEAGKAEDFERHAIDYQRQIRSAADSRWAELCAMAHGLGLDNPLFGTAPATLADSVDTAIASATGPAQRYYDGVDTERLRQASERLSAQYEKLANGGALFRDYSALLCCHLPRPTPMQWGERIGQIFGQTTLVLKREELRVPFEAELMNAIGQVMVAAELKKRRVITGTRSGASGVAVARAASMFGLDCRVYVSAGGAVSESTVRHIRSFGAEVVQVVPSGPEDSGDSRRRALIDWLIEPEHSLFVSNLQGGPRVQQKMMLDFSGVVGRECLEQCRAMGIGDLRAIYASTAGGSATLGFLAPLLRRPQLRRVVAHGGDLDQAAFRREHAWLRDSGQVEYGTIDLDTALEAQMALARVEGISISLDDARALAIALRHAVDSPDRSTSILLLSPAKLMLPPPGDDERTIRIPGKHSAARDRPISASDFG